MIWAGHVSAELQGPMDASSKTLEAKPVRSCAAAMLNVLRSSKSVQVEHVDTLFRLSAGHMTLSWDEHTWADGCNRMLAPHTVIANSTEIPGAAMDLRVETAEASLADATPQMTCFRGRKSVHKMATGKSDDELIQSDNKMGIGTRSGNFTRTPMTTSMIAWHCTMRTPTTTSTDTHMNVARIVSSVAQCHIICTRTVA